VARELVSCRLRVGYKGVIGSVDAGSYLICGKAVERIAGDHLVTFRRELGVEASGAASAVDDPAREVAWPQGEHHPVFFPGSSPGDDLVQFGDGPLLAPVGRERLVETADLAGCPVRVDYALGRGLVVFPLGLVPDPAGLFFIPRVHCPVEAFGEVAKAGPDTLVVGATLDPLLVAFRWCGHAGSSDLILPDRENVTQVEQRGNHDRISR